MTDRKILILNASLDYLAARGAILVSGWPRTNAIQITTELQLTSDERAEAVGIADDMEKYLDRP